MKKIIISLAILIVVAAGLFGYIVMNDMIGESSYSQNKENVTKAGQDRDAISGNVTEEEMAQYKEEGKNPFGEKIAQEELDDSDIQEYIHGMSHQKVRAEKKWGFYELNPTRVAWLLDGLNKAERLHHKKEYKNILEKWLDGDFSSIDDDHNAIWSLQGGTVGKATGILSKEEEQAYIDSQN